MQPRLYYPDHIFSVGEVLELDSEQSLYLSKVLRKIEGAVVHVFNSREEAQCSINTLVKAKVKLRVDNVVSVIPDEGVKIHLGVALFKKSRMEWLVEKATEIGVHSLTFLSMDYSLSNGSKQKKNFDSQRCEKIMIKALQQCRRTQPLVLGLTDQSVERWVIHWQKREVPVFYLHGYSGDSWGSVGESLREVVLLSGPEGGFSDGELEFLEQSCRAICLGPRVLRAETAPLVASTIIQYALGE